MRDTRQDIGGVVEVLTRLYREILEIEQAFHLIFGRSDMRPRIEYFHDAVRAFVASRGEAHPRLSVEQLAYDAAALHHLQHKPLALLHEDAAAKSSSKELLKKTPDAMVPKSALDRGTKERLGELYSQYAVLFVSLLRPTADTDFRDRVEELNDMIERAQNAKTTKELDAVIKTLDGAHAEFAMKQLAIFEGGKDIVKKLLGSGMNLAGQFVQNAMNKASMGRGR